MKIQKKLYLKGKDRSATLYYRNSIDEFEYI